MDRVLRELQQHEMDNNASFSVIPESQKDPEYVKEWWGNRKRIDHELSKTLLFLDSHVMEPFSFLFWMTHEKNVIASCVLNDSFVLTRSRDKQ